MNRKQTEYVAHVQRALESESARDLTKREYKEALEEIDSMVTMMLDCVRDELKTGEEE